MPTRQSSGGTGGHGAPKLAETPVAPASRRPPTAGGPAATLAGAVRALLAQLVEHFHGKEGVAGSSPAEGFWKAAAQTAFLCPDDGDAASARARGPHMGHVRSKELRRRAAENRSRRAAPQTRDRYRSEPVAERQRLVTRVQHRA